MALESEQKPYTNFSVLKHLFYYYLFTISIIPKRRVGDRG